MMIENLSANALLDAVASPLLICQNDTILFANTAAEKMLGYSCTQLKNDALTSLIYTTSTHAFSSWYCADCDSKRTIPLNVRLVTASQSLVWVKLTATDTTFDGQLVSLITMQDITAARESETEAYIGKAYRDLLLDNSPDVVVVTDAQSKLVYLSPSIAQTLGYTPEELLGKQWIDKIHPDDQAKAAHASAQIRKTNERVTIEARIKNATGDYIWFECMAGVVVQERVDQTSVISMLRNIDKHKRTELVLREREQRLRLIADNMQDIVLETAPDGLFRYISPSCTAIMGYQPEELFGQPQLNQIHPDDIPSVLEYFNQVMLTPSLKPLDMRFKHKEGHYVWFEINCNIVTDESGSLQSLIISARAIAERKAAQLALQENQHLLQQIVETTPTGIYLFDTVRNQSVFYNHNGVLGYSDTEIKQSQDSFFQSHVHPDDLSIFNDANDRLKKAKDGEVVISECRMRHANGNWHWYQYHDTVFARNQRGEPTQYLRTSYDITERKLAEEALQRNQHMLQQINDVAPIGIYIYDVKLKRDIYHNQRAIEDTTLYETVDEPTDEFYEDYAHPDDLEKHKKHQEQLMNAKDGEVIESEHRLRLVDGSYHWFSFRDIVFKRDEDGKPSQFLGSMEDITDRKNVEDSLRQSQNMLKKITDTAPFGVYIYDVKERRDIYHNQRLIEERDPKEITQRPEEDFYASYVHPDDLPIHQEHRQHLIIAQDGEVIESELRSLNKEGGYDWLYFRDIVFARDEQGKPSQFLGSMQNITERKHAEQSLRESQNLLKQITDTVPLDIYIYDVDLQRNIFFNRTENLGYPAALLDSLSAGGFYSSFVHPDDLEIHSEHTKQLLNARDGELLHVEYRMKHASGEWRWYYFRDIVFARHEDGTPRQFLGSVQDITDRKQTEEALRQSRELLSKVTSTVPMDIYIYDVDLNKGIFSNRPTHLGLGSEASLEANDEFFKNLVHPDDLTLYQDFNRRLEASPDGVFVEGEFRMRRSDGTWMWRNYRNTVLHRHADGKPSQYLGTVEDITQRKTIEAALIQSQHRFQQVAETVPMQIFIYDYDLQRNVFENRPSDLGYSVETLQTASQEFFTNLIHPDDRAHHDEIMRRLEAAPDGQMLENEFRMRAEDGTYAWRNYRYIPFARRPDGSLSQFLGTILNVDERLKVSNALRENEEKLRLITDNIHDLVALTDVNLHYRYATPSHHIILGYDPQDLVGKSVFDLVHPDDIDMVRTKAIGALDKRQPETVEFRFRHHDGYYLWLETNGSLVTGANGEITGAVFASRDVSERRWMQRAMLEQEKLLVMLQKEQELSALKTRMMSRLSHELRTPLAVISTSADLLDAYANRMTEVQRTERLQQIKGQVRHFTSMLDNMALVVKGISYSLDFAPAPYDFEETASAVVTELKDLLRVKHDVQVHMLGNKSAVNSDDQLMRLILTHLLSNAMKYSPASKPITITGALSDTAITLEVKDQGIGILSNDLERIFEPFFRGTNIGEVPGLGIGLSIVKDAVDSMQGSISVNSEVNVGTTVTVVIPLGGVIGVN